MVKKSIVLVGYMTSGKSVVGRMLAGKMGFMHLDLDALIEENAGTSIPELFASKGEIYFRKLENEVLQDVLKKKEKYVLSLGGGTPCYFNNHLLLQQAEVSSIFLKASVQTLTQRILDSRKQRPLLVDIQNSQMEEFVAKHLFDRNVYYMYAKHVITVDNKSPASITEEILALF